MRVSQAFVGMSDLANDAVLSCTDGAFNVLVWETSAEAVSLVQGVSREHVLLMITMLAHKVYRRQVERVSTCRTSRHMEYTGVFRIG
jgi:hypothetical protein